MGRLADRLRASEAAASAAALRTVAMLGLAASLLFVGLAVVSLFDGGSDPEVLGSTAERDASPTPSGDLEVASTDGGAFFVYAEDPRDNIEGSATVIVRDQGDVTLTVGGVPGHDGRAVISATVENATDTAIVFEDGLSVAVHIDFEGVSWRTVEPADRSITELRPGERASVSTEIALDRHGQYDLTGDVFFARR